MNIGHSNYWKLLMALLLAVAGSLGCQGIADMDRPIPSKKFLWKKKGAALEETSRELTDCAQGAIREGAVSAAQIGDASDICMLKKGFKFVPDSGDHRNICIMSPFRDTPSCKSWRGEYQLEK